MQRTQPSSLLPTPKPSSQWDLCFSVVVFFFFFFGAVRTQALCECSLLVSALTVVAAEYD